MTPLTSNMEATTGSSVDLRSVSAKVKGDDDCTAGRAEDGRIGLLCLVLLRLGGSRVTGGEVGDGV